MMAVRIYDDVKKWPIDEDNEKTDLEMRILIYDDLVKIYKMPKKWWKWNN